MTGLTMTDCSVADNVTQAKWEFERADGAAGKLLRADMLSLWALKWGTSLLDVAAEHAGRDEDESGDEISELEDEISTMRASIREAIDALESA